MIVRILVNLIQFILIYEMKFHINFKKKIVDLFVSIILAIK